MRVYLGSWFKQGVLDGREGVGLDCGAASCSMEDQEAKKAM